MMRVAAALAALACTACGSGEPGPGIDVERVMTCVGELAAAPRVANTPAAARTADWISAQVEALGANVERFEVGYVDLPEIVVLGTRYRSVLREHAADPDLLARYGPPGKALLVMAHYDSVPGSPGAVDNAAAACTLIELARVFAAEPPQQPVVLAWTAFEEGGLVGAEALAQRRAGDFSFAIALDLVGGDGDLVVNGASDLVGRSELAWLAAASRRAGTQLTAPLTHRLASRWWPQAERSDHGPFTRHGVRAVHLYDRGHDGELIDLAYHSPRDVPARVERGAVADLGRLLRALVAAPVPTHTGDGFWIPWTRVVVPRWVLLACDALFVAIALLALARRVRLGRDRMQGAGFWAGAVCYVVATVAALVVESLASAYPGAWLHAPVRALVAESLVLAGVLGLATRLVSRVWAWRGVDRYLVPAIVVPLAIGIALVAIGAAEIAWLWLAPAAVLAVAPVMPRIVQLPVVVAATVTPAVLVLWPPRLREGVWNGFLPPAIPLALWIGVIAIPCAGAIAWWLRGRRAGPLGTLVLSLGCGLAVVAGVAVAMTSHSPCSALEFNRLNLACEVGAGVR
jgi:hypothetical protein